MDWKDISWILRGRLRRKVIESLNSPKTATILSKELNTHRSTISDILKSITEKGYSECLDTNEPYNRYYKRTKKGDLFTSEIKKY